VRAAVLYGAGNLRIEVRPEPHAGPGQIVVRMIYAGMCGTDVEAYEHGFLPPHMVLGHENVGEIIEIGDGVTGDWQVGERIIVVTNTVAAAVNNGTIVALTKGSTWAVTDTNHLTKLTLDAHSAIKAARGSLTMTVDGATVVPTPGASYTGAIVLRVG
jgi:threonine dehydrogenase-like Zn-dependent dehydrogenase